VLLTLYDQAGVLKHSAAVTLRTGTQRPTGFSSGEAKGRTSSEKAAAPPRPSLRASFMAREAELYCTPLVHTNNARFETLKDT